jgi:hypothetical protein
VGRGPGGKGAPSSSASLEWRGESLADRRQVGRSQYNGGSFAPRPCAGTRLRDGLPYNRESETAYCGGSRSGDFTKTQSDEARVGGTRIIDRRWVVRASPSSGTKADTFARAARRPGEMSIGTRRTGDVACTMKA